MIFHDATKRLFSCICQHAICAALALAADAGAEEPDDMPNEQDA